MEYLGVIGFLSCMGMFISMVMAKYIRLRQLSVLILLTVLSVSAFSYMIVYQAVLLMSFFILVPVISNGIFYITSNIIMKKIENSHGKSGIELQFNLKNSYSFFTKE